MTQCRWCLFLLLVMLTSGSRAATPQTPLTSETEQGLQLRTHIQTLLQNNPKTRNFPVSVDIYDGLAILHGWTVDNATRALIGRIAGGVDGVNSVFNYIVSDQDIQTVPQEITRADQVMAAVTNDADLRGDVHGNQFGLGGDLRTQPENRFLDVPVVLPFRSQLAQTVQYNIGNVPYSGPYAVRVDETGGLVVLHGLVPDRNAANYAQQVAATTPGVKQVYSYLQVEQEPLPASDYPFVVELTHGPQPIPGAEEEQYVRYEGEGCEPREDSR